MGEEVDALVYVTTGLFRWLEEHEGSLPVTADAAVSSEFEDTVQPENRELARQVASVVAAEISPMTSVIGGIAAQEVLKVLILPREWAHLTTVTQLCTHKFTPLDQWLYFDALECLPDEPPADVSVSSPQAPSQIAWQVAAQGNRYDSMAAIFGRENHTKLFANASPFVVGAKSELAAI